MLRPRKITFYRMMLAGYLSAKTYRALKPKSQISDITFLDCFLFEPEICNELKRLFEEDDLIENLYYLETIEDSIYFEWNNISEILASCIKDMNSKCQKTIHIIGEKTFVLEYVFCTDESFKKLNYVSDYNFEVLTQVRKQFAAIYKDYAKYTKVKLEDTTRSELNSDYSIRSGIGFSYQDRFVIDDDALGVNNEKYKKYVLYLYSLNEDQFCIFQKFLIYVTTDKSVRLYHSIEKIGCRRFLVNYLFADQSKLIRIRNFGLKTLYEYNSIKQQIIDFVEHEYNLSNKINLDEELKEKNEISNHEVITLREYAGEGQHAVLAKLLKSLMLDVSVHTRKIINNYDGNFIEDFVYKKVNVKKINHTSKKTEFEINFIISQLRDAVNNLNRRKLTDKEIYWLDINSVYGNIIDEYCHNYYNTNGHLPMFHLLANCQSSLLKDRTFRIFESVMPIFSNEGGKGLDEVAAEYNLTRERIRQICIKCINNLHEIQNVEDSFFSLYYTILRQSKDWDYISQELSSKNIWGIDEISEILRREECSMNNEFAFVVLSTLFSDQFCIVGKTPLSLNSRNNGWSNTYLISQRLTDCFDFNVMTKIVKDYENSNIESKTLPIQELLMDTFYSAWKQYNFSVEEDLEYVVGQILVDELGIIPDIDFNYTLQGKKEDSADILYNLLKKSGEPLTIDVLYCQLNIILTNKYRSATSLRAIIKRDSRLCFLGAKKMVALSEWEHIQMGSIRELIVSYLAKFDTPRHIKDIVEYIQTYRDTTENSINSTMISGNQFVKYAGGYYGLADKTYSEWNDLLSENVQLYRKCTKDEQIFHKHIVNLEDFINENHHFPFYPSADKGEENLYLWWSKIKKKKDISDLLKKEINRIESLYNNFAKNKSDLQWLSLCDKYKEFVLANGRQPSGRNPIEAELAKWFLKTLDDVADGKLTPLREKEFIKLCKSL